MRIKNLLLFLFLLPIVIPASVSRARLLISRANSKAQQNGFVHLKLALLVVCCSTFLNSLNLLPDSNGLPLHHQSFGIA
jgi:ABC-type spermidine/putrescine transport system permease subunit II